MRVLFYHPTPEWTGGARAFAAAARGLAARGYQVTVVCSPDSPAEERLGGGDFETVAEAVPGRGWMQEGLALRRTVLDRFVEVVFVHSEREHLAAAFAVRAAERGAVVRRTPAGEDLNAGPRSRLASRLAASGFLFTTPGEVQRARLPARAMEPVTADLGVNAAAHAHVRPASPSAFGASATATYSHLLVCVCDASSRGSAATALRTAAMLLPRHPELRVMLVGPGSDHEDARMHAAALGIATTVSMLGERDDALSVLRAATLGWVIADGDAGAFGALDIMALGIPVLAARASVAARYVADGISGVLLPPGDAPASAAAVASLLAHPDRQDRMGAAGRMRVAREFTETAMVDGFQRAAEAARDRTRWVV